MSAEMQRRVVTSLDPASLSHLTDALRDECYLIWTTDPAKLSAIADAIKLVAELTDGDREKSLGHWVDGLTSVINGDLTGSVKSFSLSYEILIETGDLVEASRVAIAMVYPMALTGEYQRAIDIANRALNVFVETGDSYSSAKIEHNLGNIYHRTDDYAQSESILRSALSRLDKLADPTKYIQIQTSLANSIAHQARFDEALHIYANALDFAEQSRQAVLAAEIRSNLGRLYLIKGDHSRSMEFYEKALSGYESLGLPLQTSISELEIAEALMEINLYDEALVILERVHPVFKDLEMLQELWLTQYSRSICALRTGRLDAALDHIEAASEVAVKVKNSVQWAMIRVVAAEVEMARGDLVRAYEFALEARDIFSRSDLHQGSIDCLLLEARILASQCEFDRALKTLVECLDLAKQYRFVSVRAEIFCEIGKIRYRMGQKKEAESAFYEAIDVIESSLNLFSGDSLRAGFLSDKLTASRELIKLLLEKDCPNAISDAFHLSERFRSRTLLENVRDRRRLYAFDSIPEYAKLLDELAIEHLKISQTRRSDPVEAERLRKRANEIEQQISEMQVRAMAAGHIVGSAPEKRTDLASSIVEHLKDFEIVMSYARAGDDLVVFVIENGAQINCVKLGTVERIQDLIRRFRTLVTMPRSLRFNEYLRQTKEVLSHLYRYLIAPIEELIETKLRLNVVPCGDLFLIPFASLFDGNEYLVEAYELSMFPSAALFAELRDRERSVGFADDPSGSGVLIVGTPTPELPWVEQEVESIAQKFPDAKMLVGADATRSDFIAAVQNAQMIHFAGHCSFRADNPAYSRLELIDGGFFVQDCRLLDLTSCRLIVLSACETGVAKVTDGEEAFGLARGLISAGARSLLLSLWAVDDRAANQLMEEFYLGLAKGATAAAALRSAQISMIEKAPHPFGWGAFGIVGEGPAIWSK